MDWYQDRRSDGAKGRVRTFPSNRVLGELSGAACASCGDPHYYLVLRVGARDASAELAARCCGCHGTRGWLSESRLIRDIERTA